MKSTRKPLHEIVLHKGPLTLASLDTSIRGAIFRPASKVNGSKKRKRGLYFLGWEFIPPERSYDFVLKDLGFVTAEGVVSLAALVDCLRNTCSCDVSVKIDSQHQAWISALHLEQLVTNRWHLNFPNMPAQIQESFAFPLWRYVLGNAQDCTETASRMSVQIARILERVNHDLATEVASAARTIFKEGLLNIFEHAYTSRQDKVTFEAITVTPVPEIRELQKRGYVTSEELAWFDEHDGRLMIEIAVADTGKSVPATLGRAYCSEHPNICSKALDLRLGLTVDQISRAKLHHDITQWAFDHESTRKTPKQFDSELALLNWRGLHRALNTAAKFDGCLIMRSGQARAGYVFCDDKASALSPTSIKQHDFPGTTLVLRFPIIKASTRRIVGKRMSDSHWASGSRVDLETIVGIGSKKTKLQSLAPGRVRTVGIAHPFKKYAEEDIKHLLHMIRQIPPHIVSFHFFASLEPPMTVQLSAFRQSPEVGPPRLTAFHIKGENLVWKFVGLLPEFARSLVGSLENTGVAHIPDDSESKQFARRLVQAYDPFVRLNGSSLELIHFNAEVGDASYRSAMQLAFLDWAEKSSAAWTFEEPNEVVRLPTGRRVERYVSVLKALYAEELFAQAMGWRFSSIVRDLKREHPTLCIITESAASYFISRILLLDCEDAIDIFIGSPPEGRHWFNRPTIVFADAIHKGETLSVLLEKCRNCVAAICGIDLRDNAKNTLGKNDTHITSLVEYPFDPREIVDGSVDTNRVVLEVDAVTHIPHHVPTIDTFQIGTNAERNSFVGEQSGLFRFGLHRSGGRLHTFSLNNDQFINAHQNLLCEWIGSVIDEVVGELPKRKSLESIVIFTRTEASIKGLTQVLGQRLAIQFRRIGVFTAIIPVVPAGSREVFGRPAQLLFHGLQSLGDSELFAPEPTNFLAVYLEDSCVTGKTLLNFLIQVSKAGTSQMPRAVVAIPVLSRFSPAEETFYKDICKSLTVADHNKEIPFSFHPLFRLQIRSAERVQALPLFELIAELSSKQAGLDVRLQGYVQKIVQNILADLGSPVRASSDLPPYQHPFYSGLKGEPVIASDRTLRIRHLIALLEQNIGVLSEVLSELLLACNKDDHSLLRMLAIEPDLLKTPPLSRECRLDITNLAMRALGAQTEITTKSDALAVIALQGQPLVNRITEILVSISGVPELIDQCLVFLLTQLSSLKGSTIALEETIVNFRPSLPPEEYAYVRGCIKSYNETSAPTGIHTQSGSLRAIKKLIAGTAIHGQGHSALKSVNNWLLRTAVDRYASNVSDVRTMVTEALATVRTAIVPGLVGLHWWAESISYNLSAALAFRDAWFQILINVNNLETFLETLEDGPIGSHAANRIERFWLSIRDNSQINAPDIYLSGSIALTSHNPPIIERLAPEFFSAPFEVAVNIASKLNVTLSISSSWEQMGQGLYIVVTPIPLKAVSEVFRLLFEDMQKHGSDDSFVIKFLLERTEDRESLIAEFYNEVANDDTPGSGKSQRRATSISEEHRFGVSYDPPKVAGESYCARLTFSEILHIKCE